MLQRNFWMRELTCIRVCYMSMFEYCVQKRNIISNPDELNFISCFFFLLLPSFPSPQRLDVKAQFHSRSLSLVAILILKFFVVIFFFNTRRNRLSIYRCVRSLPHLICHAISQVAWKPAEFRISLLRKIPAR